MCPCRKMFWKFLEMIQGKISGNSFQRLDDSCRLNRQHSSTRDAEFPRVVGSPRHQENGNVACSVVSGENISLAALKQPLLTQMTFRFTTMCPCRKMFWKFLEMVQKKYISVNHFLLQDQLVSRWNLILKNGLKKDDCLNILNTYENPTNLPNLATPKLNLEISAALQKVRKGNYAYFK